VDWREDDWCRGFCRTASRVRGLVPSFLDCTTSSPFKVHGLSVEGHRQRQDVSTFRDNRTGRDLGICGINGLGVAPLFLISELAPKCAEIPYWVAADFQDCREAIPLSRRSNLRAGSADYFGEAMRAQYFMPR
jgi:hypothetical protein